MRNHNAAIALGADGHSTQRQHNTGNDGPRRLRDLDVIDVHLAREKSAANNQVVSAEFVVCLQHDPNAQTST